MPANSRRSASPPLHIEELRTRAAPLDLTGDQFRSLGHDLVDRIAGFLTAREESVRVGNALMGLGFPFDVIVMSTERFEETRT